MAQRAFATKLSKNTSAEIRSSVKSNYQLVSNSTIYSSSFSLNSEIVDSLDYEEFVKQKQLVISKDPLRVILDFPASDVLVRIQERKLRTIDYIVPADNIEELPVHIYNCINSFVKPWKICEFSHRKYSSSCMHFTERIDKEAVLYQQEYEIDRNNYTSFDDTLYISDSCSSLSSSTDNTLTPRGSWASTFDLRQVAADHLLPAILDKVPIDNVDQENEIKRSEERYFALFSSQVDVEDPNDFIERRLPAEIPIEHLGNRILIKCLQLKLELEIEPIFATMAIFDAKERKKISENFYFDMNSECIKKMLNTHVPYTSPSTTSRSAIFEITHPSNDLYLVIRLEKVLQGDNKDSEPNLLHRDKSRSNAADFCERLGSYRQPFAWTGIYLNNIFNGDNVDPDSKEKDNMSANSSNSLDRKSSTSSFDQLRKRASDMGTLSRRGSLERREKRRSWSPDDFINHVESFRPIAITVSSFFKQESDKMEDLYKFLPELKRPGNLTKKYKCIPGSVKIEIAPCPEEIKYCLTPELAKINPYPDDYTTRPVKEILEFPVLPIFNPHYGYRNLLYIRPKELNFSTRAGSARNIAIRIQLMASEKPTDALPVIFAKSSCPEFCSEMYTSVFYHNKVPNWFDEEIKILLPANLKQSHHILFTVFHVSCQKKPQEIQNAIETPIGYTWLPILIDGRLNVGDFNLPVMLEEPPDSYSYITPEVNLPLTKWLDNHRPVFNVQFDAVSSVHSLDPYLDKFLFLVECIETRKIPPRIGEFHNMEREFKKALHELQCSDLNSLVKNLQFIMDKLLELLVTNHKLGNNQLLSIQPMVFEAICSIADKLFVLQDEEYGRQQILSTYVQFQASIPHPLDPKYTDAPTSRELTRSNSNPNLKNDEMRRAVDRTASMKIDSSPHAGSSPVDKEPMIIRLLHEEVALHWVVASGSAAELSLTNSWFLFEIIIKSMIEHLDHTDSLNSPRKSRFPHQFTDDIQTLVHSVTTKIIGYHNSDTKLSSSILKSLAFFIFDLFNIMDRGFVFGLIKTFFKVITAKNTSIPELNHYKLDFLRIVCSHEHFVTLNLPFGTPFTYGSETCSSPTPSEKSNNSQTSYVNSNPDKSSFTELSHDFRQQHFLIGLMLTELSQVLEMNNPSNHGRAIRCIKNLMTSHDLDPRYNEPETRSRIAALYIPLLNLVMNTQLYQYQAEHYQLDDYQDKTSSTSTATIISPEIAFAISGSKMYNLPSEMVKNKKTQLSEVHTRNLLLCFQWVIKNLEQSVLLKWIKCLSPKRVHAMLQVLNVCIPCFEYKGRMDRQTSTSKRKTQSFRKTPDMKDKLEEIIRGTGSARADLINRRKDRNSTEKYRWRKDNFRVQPGTEGTAIKSDSIMEMNHFIEGSLSTEISLIILDVLELIIQVASMSEMHNNLLGSVLKVLLHTLSRNQSTFALQNIFATQRSICLKFHNLLFDEETDNCADLCLLLLKHCGSSLSSIRSQAAGSLYLLMRQNFESYGNNFARVKMQITMSLSSLVGSTLGNSFSETSLRRSLKTILVYAETDEYFQDSSFPEQVKDLLFNLHMILSDTVKMKEFQEDHEMLLDLMNRIAKGYQNSPDLRLTWLENMSKKHVEKSNYTEAGMCQIHCAALVAEYLYMFEAQPHLPIGAVSFKHISPNTLSESAAGDDVLSPGEDNICLGNHFSETGLRSLLENAANFFQIAGMYEAMNNVYKVLIPIAEANRDFLKLSKIHGKLQEAFNRIAQLSGKRVFGTYFRVAFFGSKFGDLDQQEFIYKEPPFTKLPEIFSRLQTFYVDRFGPILEIVKDSNVVDVSSLDPDKAYIQITYVEPYFENFELRQRETHFERNFNIKRFIFSTPFTKTGKPHGELHEQKKRKVILTTCDHFPSLKTRLQVVQRQQIVLEPIEVAIEDIQKKTIELGAATVQEPPDPKILQMVLQGCIGTTVNQGPLEMAIVFLSGIADGNIVPTKHQNKLRLCFKDFSKKCSDALKKNKNLIMADQKDYQKELERNFLSFSQQLNLLISWPTQLGANSSKSFLRW